jgi:hypothetical protein
MRNREKMTMGVVSMVVGMIGLTVGVAGQEPDGNLIINGSFEDSPDVDGYHSLDEGSDAIKGWVVTQGQIDLIGAGHWKAAAGKKSLDLNGSPGFGGIKQSFTTQKRLSRANSDAPPSAAFASAEPVHRRNETETRTGAASFGSPLSSRPTQNVSRLGRILITSRRPLSTSTTTGRAKSTSGASTQRVTSS